MTPNTPERLRERRRERDLQKAERALQELKHKMAMDRIEMLMSRPKVYWTVE